MRTRRLLQMLFLTLWLVVVPRPPAEPTSGTPAEPTSGTPADSSEGLPPGQALEVVPPPGFPPVPVPADNPITVEKLALGKRLFFEPALSLDGTISCASCHLPERYFADTQALSTGVGGVLGPRNTPTVLNSAYYPHLLSDGRASGLEDQVRYPVTHEQEMRTTPEQLVETLAARPDYVEAFAEVFGEPVIDWDRVCAALASFERTLLSGGSAFDRYYLLGDEDALDPRQRLGWELFQGRAGCVKCHRVSPAEPFFTDHDFHNTGVTWDTKKPNLGRYQITKQRYDKGRQRTPSLRNVAETPPYMLDGRFETLEEVVDFYAAGGIENLFLDEAIKPLELTAEEKDALVAFLGSLTGTVTYPHAELRVAASTPSSEVPAPSPSPTHPAANEGE